MFKKFFNKDKKKETNSESIGLAALLIHAAKIDENYSDIEKTIITKAIMDLNKIDASVAKEILDQAEIKERESNQIVEFTKEIKKKSMDFRFKVIEILWKIVYSDGANDNFESNLIRRVCGLLYVSDKDSGAIKLKIINSNK